MVPSEGVEPPCLAALGSKPSVSANSTNWAQTKKNRKNDTTTNNKNDNCSQKKLKKQKLLFKLFLTD